MEQIPKYSLYFDPKENASSPYVIREYTTSFGSWASRTHSVHSNLMTAWEALGRLSNGPIHIASSAQPADNVHDLSRDY